VLCSGISKDELIDKAQFLRRDSIVNSAMMAMGYVWRENSNEDIDKLMSEADELMYQDKRRYYEMKSS
jgi:hypothetical protein